MDKDVVIEIISGVEGHCVTLNNYRVAGQKPWGGGQVVHSFQTKQSQIDRALCRAQPESKPLTCEEGARETGDWRNTMNADEIVQWLRGLAFAQGYGACDAAAELIESLQAQLASSEIPCCECGGEVVEFTVPNDIWNSVMRPDGHETDREYLCFDCWYKALRQWMHGMQRREKAAVEDFTSAAHNGNILCEFCGADCIDAGNDTGGDTCQCGGFEWRG